MLTQELKKNAQSNMYPFHMPGHKRQIEAGWNPYALDITEIDGFDNLHHAEGMIKEAQERAARLYGVRQSFYLINGSTCGILAAIHAAVGRRKRILIARNCHKAVYHAVFLRELSAVYLYPKMTGTGIQGQITPEDVKMRLEEYPDIAAVVITSPTYDGVVSDVSKIAEIAHAHGVPLIVDEAHGAHFGFSGHFPVSAVSLGADVVIQSLHKTLPSFTQTALLHLCTERVPQKEAARYLDIFETSSPSYILMAGIDDCIRMLEENKESCFCAYWEKLRDFYRKVSGLRYLKVLTKRDFDPEEAFDLDASKILIFTGNCDLSGKELYDRLRNQYHLQMEMVSGNYVVAMTSIMDTKEGFDRLAEALAAIDSTRMPAGEGWQEVSLRMKQIYSPYEKVCEIAEAQEMPGRMLDLAEAEGEAAAEFVYLYPPGIPLLTPGERITGKFISDIRDCSRLGLEVYGITPDGRIEVVNFSGLYYT